MCEKMAGMFFSQNSITMYWKQPHFVVKVIFLLSSGVILIWWYPKNPSLNEYAS